MHIVLNVTYTLHPGAREAFLAALQQNQLLEQVRGEAGCLQYELFAAVESPDRLVLLVDEDGRLKCKAANQKATRLAPADVTENGKQPIVGAAVLMFQRGDKLLGFTKHVADTICSEWL